MELPRRKHPRLKEYDYSQTGLYFLTLCAKGKQPLFGKCVGGGVLDAEGRKWAVGDDGPYESESDDSCLCINVETTDQPNL